MAVPEGDKGGGKDKKRDKREEVKTCPECGSKCLVHDYGRAEIFCADCGLVIAENIVDPGPEWRAFDSEQMSKRARAGAPLTYRIHEGTEYAHQLGFASAGAIQSEEMGATNPYSEYSREELRIRTL